MASPREKSSTAGMSLGETLGLAGFDAHLTDVLEQIPHRLVSVEPRRPFREPGAPREEVMIVRSGILSLFKTDAGGRRQIVALRFPGEIVLPRNGMAQHGVQAIVRSELIIGKGKDLQAIIEANPQLQQFFLQLEQRNEDICYEWLVNCGRRDSTARVAHLLCEIAARMPGDETRLINPFTQQQIADITGQTSVNVNRVLADMERQGLIKRTGREIEFSDLPEIRRVASFQPAYLNI